MTHFHVKSDLVTDAQNNKAVSRSEEKEADQVIDAQNEF